MRSTRARLEIARGARIIEETLNSSLPFSGEPEAAAVASGSPLNGRGNNESCPTPMPNPVRLLHTLRQAVAAFRATPGRNGRLVIFKRVLELAALARHPGRHLVLQEVVHGPFRYPAGGDKSHQLLDLVAALKCQFPARVHFLLGNHELAQWTNQGIAKEEGDLDAQFRQGITTAYGTYAPAVYEAYRELFAVVPLALRTVNRIFLSHSLPS